MEAMTIDDAITKATALMDRVMVRDGETTTRSINLRHLKLYRDKNGRPYVRTGKRGTRREYVQSFRVLSNTPFIVVFDIAP